ncbi:hypothetical protein [Nocardia abscessus]|nr:hypothetical protein [Nocardia abscessus]
MTRFDVMYDTLPLFARLDGSAGFPAQREGGGLALIAISTTFFRQGH